jgi:hypothetical protein
MIQRLANMAPLKENRLINSLIIVVSCAHPAEDGRLHILETAVPAVIRARCRDKYETVDMLGYN